MLPHGVLIVYGCVTPVQNSYGVPHSYGDMHHIVNIIAMQGVGGGTNTSYIIQWDRVGGDNLIHSEAARRLIFKGMINIMDSKS